MSESRRTRRRGATPRLNRLDDGSFAQLACLVLGSGLRGKKHRSAPGLFRHKPLRTRPAFVQGPPTNDRGGVGEGVFRPNPLARFRYLAPMKHGCVLSVPLHLGSFDGRPGLFHFSAYFLLPMLRFAVRTEPLLLFSPAFPGFLIPLVLFFFPFFFPSQRVRFRSTEYCIVHRHIPLILYLDGSMCFSFSFSLSDAMYTCIPSKLCYSIEGRGKGVPWDGGNVVR